MLRVPSITAISIQAAECGIVIGLLGLIFFSSDFTMNTHWETGVFGFLSSEQVIYIILIVGFFTGSSQYASYAIAQHYFSPLVVASSYLMEPLLA
jgi:hypothetical protein